MNQQFSTEGADGAARTRTGIETRLCDRRWSADTFGGNSRTGSRLLCRASGALDPEEPAETFQFDARKILKGTSLYASQGQGI